VEAARNGNRECAIWGSLGLLHFCGYVRFIPNLRYAPTILAVTSGYFEALAFQASLDFSAPISFCNI
jgi:hypothetical protein